MKLFYTLAFLIGTLGNLSAQMVLFKGSFDEALKKAKEEKKDLFVDFYADWCGPCKAMESQVFTQPEVGEYFNTHFVCVQVNVEAKENSEVVKKYDVKVLPTMVFINREGKEMRRVKGAMVAAALMKEAKIATREELSFEQLYEQFKKKKKDMVKESYDSRKQKELAMASLFLHRPITSYRDILMLEEEEHWKNVMYEGVVQDLHFNGFYHATMNESTVVQSTGRHLFIMKDDNGYYVASNNQEYQIASKTFSSIEDIPQSTIDLMDDMYENRRPRDGGYPA